MSNLDMSSIKKINDEVYTVPSNSTNKTYTINIEIGICTCPSGYRGAFCKHQYFLMEYLKISVPSAPILMQSDKYSLAKLALGKKCPHFSFFGDIRNSENNNSEATETYDFSVDGRLPCDGTNESVPAEGSTVNKVDVTYATEAEKSDLRKKLSALVTNEMSQHLAKCLIDRLSDVIESKQETSTLNSINLLLKSKNQKNRIKKIKVQPTSINRRRPGVSRGASRLFQGRPARSSRV